MNEFKTDFDYKKIMFQLAPPSVRHLAVDTNDIYKQRIWTVNRMKINWLERINIYAIKQSNKQIYRTVFAGVIFLNLRYLKIKLAYLISLYSECFKTKLTNDYGGAEYPTAYKYYEQQERPICRKYRVIQTLEYIHTQRIYIIWTLQWTIRKVCGMKLFG